jgi:hypothetical protein
MPAALSEAASLGRMGTSTTLRRATHCLVCLLPQLWLVTPWHVSNPTRVSTGLAMLSQIETAAAGLWCQVSSCHGWAVVPLYYSILTEHSTSSAAATMTHLQ